MEDNTLKSDLFKKKIFLIYGKKAEEIIEAISLPRLETFRFNADPDIAENILNNLKSSGFDIEESVIPNGFINRSSANGLNVSQTDYFKTGKIYVQSLSSMLGPLILKLNSEDKILDLCASPGSKTSQMAFITGKPENITAVENNSSRFYALKKNLSIQGYSTAQTLKADATSLIRRNPQLSFSFNKVLADVPCSNEGTVRLLDITTVDKWNPRLSSKISMLQKRIVAAGINALKEDGLLVYSTCTFSYEENEMVVDWVLKKFPEMKLILPELPTGFKNYISGLDTCCDRQLSKEVCKSVRVLPDSFFDGFFIALFRKESGRAL